MPPSIPPSLANLSPCSPPTVPLRKPSACFPCLCHTSPLDRPTATEAGFSARRRRGGNGGAGNAAFAAHSKKRKETTTTTAAAATEGGREGGRASGPATPSIHRCTVVLSCVGRILTWAGGSLRPSESACDRSRKRPRSGQILIN